MPKVLHSPSVNIQRDAARDFVYYPTDNGDRIVEQLRGDFEAGIRSFLLIGSYGTGKSAFLWAYAKSLIAPKNDRFYEAELVPGVKKSAVDILSLVGEYSSLLDLLAIHLDVHETKDKGKHVLQALYDRYSERKEPKKLLLLLVDEFGKHLEYAAKNNPEQELYFLQQLAEFCNDNRRNVCLLATVHQNFDAYAEGLNQRQRNEWSKIKGRFKEIAFNEPVEQLLFLASEHLSTRETKLSAAKVKAARKVAKDTKALSFSPGFIEDIAAKLAPLDLLAAQAITIGLQRYGQNERSLFTFLQSADHTSISRFSSSAKTPFYSLANAYDYFVFNFYSLLYSRVNPDLLHWSSMRSTLEALDRMDQQNRDGLEKIVKTIGLINLFAPNRVLLTKDILAEYAKVCLGEPEGEVLIDALQKQKLIIFRAHKQRYVLSEGTDLDLHFELERATSLVEAITDVPNQIRAYFDLPPLVAKRHSFQKGTPRVFAYRLTSEPIKEVPKGDVDGFINLIFAESLTLEQIKKKSAETGEAILYGYYRQSGKIKEQLFDIARTNRVIQEHTDDKVAQRELKSVLEHQRNLLNHYILDGQFSNDVVWVFNGKLLSEGYGSIANQRDLNAALSWICDEVFTAAPEFRNELINRHRISPSVQVARRSFLARLVDRWHEPNLGWGKDEFPPDKAIYLSLVVEGAGISLEGSATSEAPKGNASFETLLRACDQFITKSQRAKLPVQELVEELERPPFKLKQGFLDFWVPLYLFSRRNDYALFHEGNYVPSLSSDTLELIVRYPRRFEVKAFEIEGIRLELFNHYREFTNLDRTLFSNNAFIETVKPFLSFYRDLPAYSKTTKRLSKEAIELRSAIARAKDPEKTFFEDFPVALGHSTESLLNPLANLRPYIEALQNSIREIRSAYGDLVSRFEEVLLDRLHTSDSSSLEAKLRARLARVKAHMLTPAQKVFVQRAGIEQDKRETYLSSLAQALVGKPLAAFTDEDEPLLHDRLTRMLTDLDRISELSPEDLDPEKERLLTVEIAGSAKGLLKANLRLSAQQSTEVAAQVEVLRKNVTGDAAVNIAALTSLLEELLGNGQG